ncbi:RnfABCDGE type electron transport complex subunit G [Tahibacter caeni]|uniref:RnfABCDGE type electron transport complex subunit G n=1 Tax=Tahibacter caeni TaxID=1453545 RepID=UPI0021477FD2|nr:RnfABCDGE type electron transport complex subunit G [Tahibacter caeni]
MAEARRPWPLAAQALLALAALAFAAWLSQDGLREQAQLRERGELAGLLPGLDYDNDPLADRIAVRDPAALGSDDPQPLWRLRRGDAAVACIVDAVAQGYGGPLQLRLGIARDGRLLGVRVLAHRESRGRGDAFEHDGGRWLAALSGHSLQDLPAERWRVRRDGGAFDQFAGATVTPRAILARIQAVLAAYADHGERWLADAEPR